MMTKRKVKPGSERDVQRRAIIWLRKEGWLVVNTSGAWRSARGMAGFPDMLCIYKGFVAFVEVKGFKRLDLRPTQVRFLEKLEPHLDSQVSILYFIVNDENFETWQSRMKYFKDWSDENDRII